MLACKTFRRPFKIVGLWHALTLKNPRKLKSLWSNHQVSSSVSNRNPLRLLGELCHSQGQRCWEGRIAQYLGGSLTNKWRWRSQGHSCGAFGFPGLMFLGARQWDVWRKLLGWQMPQDVFSDAINAHGCVKQIWGPHALLHCGCCWVALQTQTKKGRFKTMCSRKELRH